MTPKEARAAMRKLESMVGAGHRISIHLVTHGEVPLTGSVYRNSGNYNAVVDANADTFDDLIPRLEAMWIEYLSSSRATRIKGMALAIIKITDEQGACNEAALRIAQFSREEIADLGAEAATKANTMAANGPFSIERSANANTPEAA